VDEGKFASFFMVDGMEEGIGNVVFCGGNRCSFVS
jgi:hypothetical protein